MTLNWLNESFQIKIIIIEIIIQLLKWGNNWFNLDTFIVFLCSNCSFDSEKMGFLLWDLKKHIKSALKKSHNLPHIYIMALFCRIISLENVAEFPIFCRTLSEALYKGASTKHCSTNYNNINIAMLPSGSYLITLQII